MRAKVFRLAVCRISRICAVICHVEDSHIWGDLHDIVPRGVANSTWRCNCNCNLDNLDNSWSGNANAIYGLEEVAWGLLIFFPFLIYINRCLSWFWAMPTVSVKYLTRGYRMFAHKDNGKQQRQRQRRRQPCCTYLDPVRVMQPPRRGAPMRPARRATRASNSSPVPSLFLLVFALRSDLCVRPLQYK